MINTYLLEEDPERRTTALVSKQREIRLPIPPPNPFLSNKIRTSKYTFYNFIPKNLFQQFKKISNLYFLVISILQAIPQISVSEGIPNLLLPLFIVILFSLIKDVLEDLKRKKSDRDENNCVVKKRVSRDWTNAIWSDVQVGDILKIYKNEYFPADMILISSSDDKGICYVETKNLDGETNMKHKIANKESQIFYEFEARLDDFNAHLKFPDANPLIYHFEGVLNTTRKAIPLEYNQFLLRGSSLKNTDWVVGVVVYTGHDTKIMLNSPRARQKSSKVEALINREIIYIFLLQVLLCIFAAVYYCIWFNYAKSKTNDYLGLKSDSQSLTLEFIFTFFTWMLLLMNFVPISLLVTLEMVRYVQAAFITNDLCLYYEPYDMKAGVQSSNLNEELGQINYVFSDKTGTLTCNVMEFRKMSINGKSFGTDKRMEDKPVGVDFVDPEFKINDKSTEDFLLHLACCQTIITQTTDKGIEYNSSSPDELSLANAAKYFGVEFVERSENMIFIKVGEKMISVQVLHIIEFTSERKRMTVIAKFPEGKIKILCKGADNIILPRVVNKDLVEVTLRHLENYANDGLRTLIIAYKDIKESEYRSWKIQYDDALLDTRHKDKRLLEINEIVESELILMGATAIEDKLQTGVYETIKFIKEAGIKTWVLTGDKVETAINIGFSCGLLNEEIIRVYITARKTLNIRQELKKGLETIKINDVKFGLVITGEALIKINKPDILTEFLEISEKCEVVLACRVSPQQKAEIVNLIRKNDKNSRTLAIGDGANDVNMICAAHIGIGLAGLEGQQAVRASDYSIAQFSYLKRLICVHGRECYRRNSILICYNFYKNILITIPLFYYGIFSVFSGQVLYNMWSYQFFNIFFAALPICIYAMFDRQYDYTVLESNPKHYHVGLKGKLFNSGVFWIWVFEASWQGLVILIICIFAIFQSTGDKHTGKMDNMWVGSELVFGIIVITVNLKVIFLSYTNYWFNILICVLCILSYFLFAWIITDWIIIDIFFDNYDSRGSTYKMAINPNSYIAGVLVIFLSFMPGPVIVRAYKTCKKRKKALPEKELDLSLSDSVKNFQENYTPHTGFAFSGEAGHVPQIIHPEYFY